MAEVASVATATPLAVLELFWSSIQPEVGSASGTSVAGAGVPEVSPPTTFWAKPITAARPAVSSCDDGETLTEKKYALLIALTHQPTPVLPMRAWSQPPPPTLTSLRPASTEPVAVPASGLTPRVFAKSRFKNCAATADAEVVSAYPLNCTSKYKALKWAYATMPASSGDPSATDAA